MIFIVYVPFRRRQDANVEVVVLRDFDGVEIFLDGYGHDVAEAGEKREVAGRTGDLRTESGIVIYCWPLRG